MAAAYALLDTYQRVFRYPWTELLAFRLRGQDLVTLGQLAEHFAEAERVLRRALYDGPGQAMIEKALAETLARIPKVAAPAGWRTRVGNAWLSVTFGVQVLCIGLAGRQATAVVEHLARRRRRGGGGGEAGNPGVRSWGWAAAGEVGAGEAGVRSAPMWELAETVPANVRDYWTQRVVATYETELYALAFGATSRAAALAPRSQSRLDRQPRAGATRLASSSSARSVYS